jgi:pilus assembly protein CpaE
MMPKTDIRRLAADERGASAVEFALFAPLLVGCLLLMVDIGLLVGTRMGLDRNVRAGAQAAMALNNDAEAIRRIVLTSAGAPRAMSVSVERHCACAEAIVTCTAICTGQPPSVFFTIRAERPHPGMVLGERQVASSTRVQIR